MRLSRAATSEDQKVLASVQERTIQQRAHLPGHLQRQAFQIEARQVLLRGNPGLPQQSLDPVCLPTLALLPAQFEQVLLVRQRLLFITSWASTTCFLPAVGGGRAV